MPRLGRRSRERKKRPVPAACPTCAAPILEAYCPACGEMRADLRHEGLIHVVLDAVEGFTHADGKTLGTLGMLFKSPGRLTLEFLRGARKLHLGPVQLFFVANLIFFVLQSVLHWQAMSTPFRVHIEMMSYSRTARAHAEAFAAAHAMEMSQVERAFDAVVSGYAKSLILLMVPLFAFGSLLVCVRARRGVLAHLVYALHFFAALLLAFGLVVLPLGTAMERGLVGGLRGTQIDTVLSALTLLGVLAYHAFALRTAFGFTGRASAWRALCMVALFVIVSLAYRVVLFSIVLHTMPLA